MNENVNGVVPELELEKEITDGLKRVIMDLLRDTPTSAAIREKFNLSAKRANEIEAVLVVINEEKEQN
jgi:hypothetical protein